MQRYKILWADDEIDLLKPHILFLEQKGYEVTPVVSGMDALEKCAEEFYDVVFLDENMPGLSGLETLTQIKKIKPSLPVVMITKTEEEHIMEEAIGAKIADYLIKPLKPSQILLSIKKILENKRLITEKTSLSYQQDFRNISMAFMDYMDHQEWSEIYKKLVYWELELDGVEDPGMFEVLENQKSEANNNFAKFIEDNYASWLNDPDVEKPLLSHQIIKEKVLPAVDEQPLFMLLIDNLRFDQWKILEPIISQYFTVEQEELYYSILPTTTAYSRNAIFAGMLPSEIAKKHPGLWVGEDSEEGKNRYEDKLLERQFRRLNVDVNFSYHKILNIHEGKQLADNVQNLMNQDLIVIVYNFVDMLSHARTDMAMIRELAPDESAYRSITRSWFEHSPILDTLKTIAAKGGKLIITTDHGTIRVKRPFKILGDRTVSTNLRYKQGKNLSYDAGKIMEVSNPDDIFLPKYNVSTRYVFALEDQFFAYPNNYNYYVNYYKDTFQHGGISMEEMIIPIISLNSKNV
ncbi:MAG: PglZ domain-containing protein [Candidatus Cyclobacteriaceae bacterium M2_1C_046]